MSYYFGLLVAFLAIGLTAFGVYFIYSYLKEKKLKAILATPFPLKYEEILQKIPLYIKLNASEQKEIQKSILIFLNTKEFTGINIDVTDEMKVVIAFHACVLLLNATLKSCYENLATILIYSHTIVAKQISNNGGIFTKGDFLLEGQSASDTVIIAWNDAKKDAYHIHNDNVVIHEFAHELDFLDGIADGTPPLPDAKYHEWAKTFSSEFNKLSKVALKNRNWGNYKLIGAYAATNEAEFFAVLTERYFENPQALRRHFPDLFKELNSFYQFYHE